MSDGLSVNLAEATAAFAKDLASNQPGTPESAPTGINPEPVQKIDSDIEVPDSPFWSKEEEIVPGFKVKTEQKPEAQKPEESAKGSAPNVLTAKANGKEIQLDLSNPEHLARVQKAVAAFEGTQKAFAKAAKVEQQAELKAKQLEAELQEARQYKDSWDKLEQLRHDKGKLLELITGQSYDDFIQKEVERQQILKYGTEEEKALVQQSERATVLEQKLKAMEAAASKREEDAQRAAKIAQEAQDAAANEQVKSQLQKSFFDHVKAELPDDLKQLVYQKTILDLKKLHKEYGRVTNKMIDKTMSDNAKRLSTFQESSVQSELNKAVENKKQTATAQAQAASTKNYEQDVEGLNLASLTPDKLFQAMKFLNRKSR